MLAMSLSSANCLCFYQPLLAPTGPLFHGAFSVSGNTSNKWSFTHETPVQAQWSIHSFQHTMFRCRLCVRSSCKTRLPVFRNPTDGYLMSNHHLTTIYGSFMTEWQWPHNILKLKAGLFKGTLQLSLRTYEGNRSKWCKRKRGRKGGGVPTTHSEIIQSSEVLHQVEREEGRREREGDVACSLNIIVLHRYTYFTTHFIVKTHFIVWGPIF